MISYGMGSDRQLRDMKTREQIKVFEAFAGYGSQSIALERLKRHFPEFDYEVVGISEIDKYAVTAYNALHGDVPNYGDISKIDWKEVPDFDLFTMSSPCQDFSQAGLQKGGAEGSGTRSSLLWECRRAILAKKPKYIVFENVKALVSQKFLPYFLKWQNELASYGYTNFARVLNAKDFGVPQNRERIFLVSILDRQATYHFPEPFPLDRRIKDVLEEDVDERYFLSEKLVDYVFSNGGKAGDIKGATGVHEPDDDIAGTITAQYWKTPRQGNYIKYPSDKTICLNSKVDGKQPSLEHRVYDCGGISTAITTGFMPSVLTPKRNEYGKSVRREYESGELRESRHKMADLEPRTDGVSNTITTVQKDNLLCVPVAVIGSAQKNAYVGSVDGPSPCINAACGMGGGQTQMVVMAAERLREMAAASRSEEVGITIDEDGNLRPHRLDRAKSGISEYQTERDTSTASTVIAARPNNVYGESTDYRIRKLTPRECLRLMDVDDADIDKLIAAGISNTQLYKMAGNSIVVNVLYHIFRKMFVNKENENIQLTLF